MMASERTPLTEQSTPQYAFQSVGLRQRRRRTRQFQCCVCALLLALVIGLSVVTVSYIEAGGDDDAVSDAEMEAAVQAGTEALHAKDLVEQSSGTLLMASPSYRHQKSVATSVEADLLAQAGYASYMASRHLATKSKYKYNGSHPMRTVCDKRQIVDAGWCRMKTDSCTPSRYRSIDGSCNNLEHSAEWGVAFTKFRRMVAPSYADGVGVPRSAHAGGILPTASVVSNTVHRPVYRNDPKFTVMLAVWGQFMDHDITATALSRSKNGSPIACCSSSIPHPECFPVYEKQADGSVWCMEFVRSAPAPTCCLGPREQINQVSAYLDGSVVYGADLRLTKNLRSFQAGRLKMLQTTDDRQLLPVSKDPTDGCNRQEMNSAGKYCFLSGDQRANENLHLTTMHLLWARQHNLIAAELQNLNPHWNDERLYQEARHIVAAQIQHITYSEFLPVVLGDKLMVQHKLTPAVDGYFEGYNATIDASIANGFAAAAFRFAHTLIPSLVRILGNDTSSPEYVQLHQMLFNPYRLYREGELDAALRGAMHTPIEASDPYFADELKSHLFERDDEQNSSKPARCGLDLVALNIQRGRDHGLPSYTTWREVCGLSKPRNFADMAAYVDGASLERILGLYAHVDDIDLYTGALSEHPVTGSLLGPTASCIIVDQFVRLKRGDRYWYEGGPERGPQAFAPRQLVEIRRSSLAAVICDNADALDTVSRHVMRREDGGVPCSVVDRPDLTHWKD